MVGGFTSVVEYTVKERNFIRPGMGFCENLQSVIVTIEYGSKKGVRKSFILICGEESSAKVLWMARVVMLLQSSCRNSDALVCLHSFSSYRVWSLWTK